MNLKTARVEDRDLLDRIKKLPCCICNRHPVDPAHIKTVATGGPDLEWNVLPLCRVHHGEQHAKGFHHMINKYEKFEEVLYLKGWEFNGVRLWHDQILKHRDGG